MTTHRVRILSSDLRALLEDSTTSHKPGLVIPGLLFLDGMQNHMIEFVSLGSAAKVTIPDLKVVLDVPENGRQTVVISSGFKPATIFSYSVLIDQDGKQAEGNSSPKIIVE